MDFSTYDLSFGPIPQHRFFSTQDLSIPDDYCPGVEKVLIRDGRFLSIKKVGKPEYFILKKTLFNWFINLNLNLAEAGISRLNCRKFSALLNYIRAEGGWWNIPEEILQFGSEYGLIQKSYFDNILVFPLAFLFRHTISYLSYSEGLISEIIDLLLNEKGQTSSIESILQELFSKFDERVIYIVLSREGILTGVKRTLEEIGKDLKITRERIRQIEKKFWRRARHPTNRRIVFKALLADFLRNKGGLIYKDNKKLRNYRHFVLKYLRISYLYLPKENFTFLGINPAVFDELQSSARLKEKIILRRGISKFIFRVSKFDCSKEDFKIFRKIIISNQKHRLTKAKRVFLVLRKIGRPAHYSIVAREYQKLYPKDNMTEHNIHAILGRSDSNKIVWIGVKGTYALRKWGYKKPDKGLFRTIEEIVENVYKKTGKPVPVATINAELGKYRKIVNLISVAYVLGYSKNLKKVNVNQYIPLNRKGVEKSRVLFSRLDRILSKFQSKNF